MDDVHFEPVGQIISVLSASLFAIHAFRYLEGLKLEGGEKISELGAFILVLPASALVHFSIEFLLLKWPIKFKAIRRMVSRASSIEGYWLQVVDSSETPFSIVCIEFDPATKGYVYHGINYKADLSRNALFRSTIASVDDSENNLTFHFDATVRVCSDNAHLSEAARGYGNIKFMTEGSSSFVRGVGEFFERKPQADWHTFELHRITRADVRKALGRSRQYAADSQDYDKLLMFELDQQEKKTKAVDRFRKDFRVVPQSCTDGLESARSVGEIGAGETAPQ